MKTPSQTRILMYRLLAAMDSRGQDLLEYALMAGFVAVAAGAISPNIATNISTVFSRLTSELNAAKNQGS